MSTHYVPRVDLDLVCISCFCYYLFPVGLREGLGVLDKRCQLFHSSSSALAQSSPSSGAAECSVSADSSGDGHVPESAQVVSLFALAASLSALAGGLPRRPAGACAGERRVSEPGVVDAAAVDAAAAASPALNSVPSHLSL